MLNEDYLRNKQEAEDLTVEKARADAFGFISLAETKLENRLNDHEKRLKALEGGKDALSTEAGRSETLGAILEAAESEKELWSILDQVKNELESRGHLPTGEFKE
jgi:hypothetical protein